MAIVLLVPIIGTILNHGWSSKCTRLGGQQLTAHSLPPLKHRRQTGWRVSHLHVLCRIHAVFVHLPSQHCRPHEE